MNLNHVVLVLLLSVAFYPAVVAAKQSNVDIEFITDPQEPNSFQPFFDGNRQAKVLISVRDQSSGELIEGAKIKFSIDHVRGKDILNTGFPYLEGKRVLAGSFVIPKGQQEFNYAFPVRGNYRVLIEASPTELSRPFEPTSKEFKLHVKEWGFEVRNAVILGALLLIFGIGIGVIYGRAHSVGEFR